ncbi:hypothetical protein BDQ94DRAFT_164111 [Aspergillus welwitschiae]|uniref:Ferredoxin reductase-like protein n=1 Tax=Aspergillus welwitschiae TaxID=1341132 RepID=A0A3F3PKK3_9EURO|nr:hypothetical protein BDQ94DRAFT_164111 [Aspergillus welwitschiae]RDH26886.1 hypothetical protein BDQ94DRAFT_164111 [Aspergillus welwitschiae]
MGVYSGIGPCFLSTAFAESPEPPSIFGWFGLTTLRLQSVETIRKGSIELMVKKYPNGKASGYFHSLIPGDTVTFAAVLKGFSWTANQFLQVHLIAGGAGITPIYQLIQGILRDPNDQTKINLIFGVSTEQDLLLKDELEGDPEGDSFLSYKGYITEELLRKALHGSEKNSKIFIYRPEGLENSLMDSRKAPGILE